MAAKKSKTKKKKSTVIAKGRQKPAARPASPASPKPASAVTNKASFPIVGIGASAGGLEALQRFLDALPRGFNFALVFVQHLPAQYKSLLPELLSAKHSSLVIQEISDGLKIQPGRLYLAPPGKEVRLQNGLFQTTVHTEGLIHLPIDEFLSSLAQDAGERSIAVIFSGAGTDGARGCRAVRTAGGTVFVQDPETAEFGSMPLAAIATGQPDAVLSPEDIIAELLKLQEVGKTEVTREYPITPEEYGDFFRLLQEKTGSRFNHYKKSVVSRRIRRRMYLQGLSTVKEYLDLVSTGDAEAALLASDLMIGVTSFFRDRVAWKALNVETIRKIAAEDTNLPIRVWTPATATGEEAYSIAMMLLHELALAGGKRDIHVFATDVNDRALERAREGKYPFSITADVPQEYIQKYFTSTEDGNFLVINKEVRECVVFARQDLLIDPPFSKLDLIICRNFLIYLEPEAQDKSITLFHYALKEGGYLFLGNAETVGKKCSLFKSIGHKQCRVYRKLETKPASRLPISVPYAAERQASLSKQAQTREQNRSIVEIIQEKLLEEYGPASVAIDQNYEIIYHNGPTNRYLLQPRGVPTQNFLELVPESLRSRVRGALYRSGREERPVVIRTSMNGDDNKKRYVSLRITKADENLSIVVFQEKSAPSTKEIAEQVDATVIEETAIHQLESELSATRSDLQSHIEQLKSMNEEFQSSNEELQAANEELETSREELQSLNEELITVNSQLQCKIEEQDATNNDLNNFQASTNIPMIFLDQQFKVKRFTPAMLKLIKLLPSDVGRPIVDMSQENLGPDLIVDSQTVLGSLLPVKKELEIAGVCYIRTTLPYRTADNRIEGVVITYTDITERKHDEEIRGRLSAIVENADEAIISKDLNGVILTWNAGAEKIFGYTAQEAINRNVSFLVPPGHVDEVPAILKRIAEGEHVEQFETERMRKDGTIIPVSLTFSPIRDASGRVVGVSKISHDITERKRAEKALRENELKASALINVADESIWLFGLHNDILAANVTAARRLGMSVSDVVGKKWTDLIPPALAASRKKKVAEVVSSGNPLHFEDERAGMIFEHIVYPVQDDTGAITSVAFFSRDITERKRIQEELRKSEELFRLAVDNMPGALGIYDAERRYKFVNAAGLQRLGKPLEDLIGRRVDDMYDEEARKVFWPSLMRAYETGAPQTVECAVNWPTGKYELIINFIPMLKDGRVDQVLNFTFDITERKRVEDALRQNETKFKTVFDTSVDAIGVSKDGKHVFVNAAYLSLYGYGSEQELAGRPILDLIAPSEHDKIREYAKQRSNGNAAAPPAYETRGLREDGSEFDMDVRVTTYTLSGDVYTLVIIRDITKRKQAEEALKAAHQEIKRRAYELEAVNRELEAFSYTVSHDLKAPLRSIDGFAKALLEDYQDKLDTTGADYLKRVNAATLRMNQFIEAMLNMARLTRGELHEKTVNLSSLAQIAAHELRKSDPERQAEFVIAEKVNTKGDQDMLTIVLQNLLDNAWKFTSNHSTAKIEFGVTDMDGKTVYFVRDDGAGFDMRYADKLFQPFKRLHADSEFPGLGIGLAIAHRIIMRHGGRMWAESAPEKGATFYFTL